MPRRRPYLNDSDDPDEVRRFVKDLASCSHYKYLQELVNDDPELLRTATLERRNPNEPLKVSCQPRKAAIAIHIYGQIAEKASEVLLPWLKR